MPHAKCHHCETEISDHTSMVERRGELYCCNSCAEAMLGEGQREGERCAHCGSVIVDPRTQVYRGDQTFCCMNCAEAVPARSA